MSAMKREKQYDMFDVATGTCTLEDYLFQRYSENDLSSRFWIDEKDEVDELRPPKAGPDGQPGTEPVIIPIQGPRAAKSSQPKPPALPEGLEPQGPTKVPAPSTYGENTTKPAELDGRDTLSSSETPVQPGISLESFKSGVSPTSSPDTFQTQSGAKEQGAGSEELPPEPPSMEALLARFHQATQEYQQRSQQAEDPTGEPADEEV